MKIIEKINACQTMRELDEMRIEIVHAIEAGEEPKILQQTFIKKKNSLKRKGHTRQNEGYELNDVIKYQDMKG